MSESFRASMAKAGLAFAGSIVADGQLHRFKAEGDKAPNSWFVLFPGPPLAGAFGCWKLGIKEIWCEREVRTMSPVERQRVHDQWQRADAERERIQAERHAEARVEVVRILSEAKPTKTHAYLDRKFVKAFGDVRENRGKLVLPLGDADGELHSLQFIDANGAKKFLTGGRVAGCFFTVSDKADGPLVIVEGYATGASVHTATGFATVAGLNCGNLLAVAKALRARWPNREFILAADDDRETSGNPGLTAAMEAAKAVGARLAMPRFKDASTKGTDFNDLHQQEGIDIVKTQIETSSLSLANDEWPAPKPLPDDLPAVQPFDFACLPGTLRPWLHDISERMQCPPDFPAVGAIIALGSLIGRKLGIRPKRQDDWLIVPNLWGMIVGRPGLMKTPALEQALAPLNRLVAEALKKHESELAAHEVNAVLAGQRKKMTEGKIGDLLKKGDEKGARALAESVLKGAATAPVLRRYVVNDATVEKLGELLNQNPNGLLQHRDEIMGLLTSLDKEGWESARAFLLEAWTGTGSFTYDRIGRGTVRIEAVTLAILGAIQPGPLADYLRQAVRSGVGDDGLLQRFQLAVWPDVSPKWKNVDRWPDSTAKNEAFAAFQDLDHLSAAAVGANGTDGIPFLRFSPDAQEVFDFWRTKLETVLRSDCHHPAFEAHLAKYRKLVPALALILHLVNGDKGPVTLAALEKALRWTTYLESHARRIYSAVLRPDAAAARELAKHLQRGDLVGKFTLRETYRKGWTGIATKEDAESATEILTDLGWIRPAQSADRANGRPASPTFEIHPKISELPAPPTDKTATTPQTEVLTVASVAPAPDVEISSAPDVQSEIPQPTPVVTAITDKSSEHELAQAADLL